jgi:chemotaxis protein MotB
LKGAADSAGAGAAAAQGKVSELAGQLEGEKKISTRALAQVEVLSQQIAALRRQLAAIEQTLDAAEKKDKESQTRITELGQRLNLALAERVNELKRYRSDFFGKLREILGNRADVRVVGDLVELEKQIPPDLAWVLRVDGHTDVRQLSLGGAFKSNWDLSAARAIAVVQYLITRGVSPQRLVAAGFGEFQPIDLGKTEEAYQRNRRIEFKLTER